MTNNSKLTIKETEQFPSIEKTGRSYNELYKITRIDEDIQGWVYDQSRIHLTIFRFLQLLDLGSDAKLLEVGCGRGELTNKLVWLYPNTFAIDISATGIEATKKITNGKVALLLGDATNLPFNQSSFDVIICSEVIEHIIDKEKLINEINRTLHQKGYLILTTPNPYALRGFTASFIAKILGLQGESKQIINIFISPRNLKKMLSSYFKVEYIVGLVYNLPYMERMNDLPKRYQNIMIFMNRISESIERRNQFKGLAQYLCFCCKKK